MAQREIFLYPYFLYKMGGFKPKNNRTLLCPLKTMIRVAEEKNTGKQPQTRQFHPPYFNYFSFSETMGGIKPKTISRYCPFKTMIAGAEEKNPRKHPQTRPSHSTLCITTIFLSARQLAKKPPAATVSLRQ
jgi:hypothetical protein